MDIPRHDFTRWFELMETRWHPICTDKSGTSSSSSYLVSFSVSVSVSLPFLSRSHPATCPRTFYHPRWRFQTRFTSRCVKAIMRVDFSICAKFARPNIHMCGKSRASAQSVSAANSVKARKSIDVRDWVTVQEIITGPKFFVMVSDRLKLSWLSDVRTYKKVRK